MEQKVRPQPLLLLMMMIHSILSVEVNEWWAVCDKLAKKLPSTDPVLEQWREKVEKMQSNMSTLQLLASRDIQVSSN